MRGGKEGPAAPSSSRCCHWASRVCSLWTLLLLVSAALLYGSLALHTAAAAAHRTQPGPLLPTFHLRAEAEAAAAAAAASSSATTPNGGSSNSWRPASWLQQAAAAGVLGAGRLQNTSSSSSKTTAFTQRAVVADVPGYPAGPPYRFPKLIHQTVRDKAAMACEVQEAVESWVRLNPGYQHILYDDADLAAFVAQHYPQLAELFAALPTNIERTDTWRYLVLHKLGGVYADSDVKCMQPIDSWNAAHGHDAGLLVGIAKRNTRTGATSEFNQFVIAAMPGHPVLASMPLVVAGNLAAYHLAHLPGLGGAEQAAAAYRTRGKQHDAAILARTGPKAFTAALRAYARRAGARWPVNSTAADATGGVLFGSVRAMPKFALGMGWDTLDHNMTCEQVKASLRPEALICHQFLGSWKAHPEAQLRERRLTYGDCGRAQQGQHQQQLSGMPLSGTPLLGVPEASSGGILPLPQQQQPQQAVVVSYTTAGDDDNTGAAAAAAAAVSSATVAPVASAAAAGADAVDHSNPDASADDGVAALVVIEGPGGSSEEDADGEEDEDSDGDHEEEEEGDGFGDGADEAGELAASGGGLAAAAAAAASATFVGGGGGSGLPAATAAGVRVVSYTSEA